MKNILFVTALVIFLAGCDEEHRQSGSNNMISEKRSVSGPFTKINASTGIEVEIRNADVPDIKVEADDNVLQDVQTSVSNGTLTIRIKEESSFNNTHVRVYVSAPKINSITASASAVVEIKNKLTTDGELDLETSSSANIGGEVDAPSVSANASSGSEMKISGRTRNFNAEASSGASVRAFELLSENTVANASSGASLDAFASVSFDGNASSGGAISYRGAAPTVKKQESSGGSMHKED